MTHSSKFLLAAALLLLTACGSVNRILLEDLPPELAMPVTNKAETHIKPGDRLAITVSCKNPELSAPFNGISYMKSTTGQTIEASDQGESGYLVDDDGMINFPILGKLKVSGLTRPELSRQIEGLLIEGKHIPDPAVETRITNFTIYSLGGVTPRKLVVPEGEINLLQALAQLGDLQQRAKYEKVRVIRENDNQRIEYDVDVTTIAMFDSPAFHLQQNDIVYAEPKKRTTNAFNTTATVISLIAVLASLAYTITFIIR